MFLYDANRRSKFFTNFIRHCQIQNRFDRSLSMWLPVIFYYEIYIGSTWCAAFRIGTQRSTFWCTASPNVDFKKNRLSTIGYNTVEFSFSLFGFSTPKVDFRTSSFGPSFHGSHKDDGKEFVLSVELWTDSIKWASPFESTNCFKICAAVPRLNF